MEQKTRKVVLRGAGCGECGGCYEVAAGESLELYQLCGEGDHKVRVTLAEGARAKLLFVASTSGSVSYDYRVELNGAGAEAELWGLFVARERGVAKVHTDMRHNVADCRSNQQVRGVADNEGYGLFEGLVYVAPDAQRTEAYQQSRNVVLSPTARIQTLPQLEIYADDVKCSHGATVGQMNEEQIYYMRQRGLSEEDARKLQLGGFIRQVLDRVDDELLREEMERLLFPAE